MVDVELNHLYQVNTTHLLMEVCSHIQWKRAMQVEVLTFSGRGQWKRSTEVVDLCGLPQLHLCCMLSVLYQGSFHWPTQCTHEGVHVAYNS